MPEQPSSEAAQRSPQTLPPRNIEALFFETGGGIAPLGGVMTPRNPAPARVRPDMQGRIALADRTNQQNTPAGR